MGWDRLAVVMPAYNEHAGIAVFIAEIASALGPLCAELDFVVVDDSSDVPLTSILEDENAGPYGVTVVRNPSNVGHGPSVLKAYALGLGLDADAIVHVDGDGQFEGDDIARIVTQLEDYDVVLGARVNRQDPWYRKLISRSLRVLVRNRKIPDVNTPLRAYRPWALRELVARTPGASTVPHIHFSRLASSQRHHLVSIQVAHRPRLGPDTEGSTWGGGRPAFLPPLRLARFCARALREIRKPEHETGSSAEVGARS